MFTELRGGGGHSYAFVVAIESFVMLETPTQFTPTLRATRQLLRRALTLPKGNSAPQTMQAYVSRFDYRHPSIPLLILYQWPSFCHSIHQRRHQFLQFTLTNFRHQPC